MTLVSSGILSIGGSTTNRSINLELSLSATTNSNLNQTNFRSLAGVSSGKISISNFYGKSAEGGCEEIELYYSSRGSGDVCAGEGRTATYYINGEYGSGDIFNEGSCEECTAGYYSNATGRTNVYAIVSAGREGCATVWETCE